MKPKELEKPAASVPFGADSGFGRDQMSSQGQKPGVEKAVVGPQVVVVVVVAAVVAAAVLS